jgi:F0F1-type ATP synthase assembly protein I
MTVGLRNRIILLIFLPIIGYFTINELLSLELFVERTGSDSDRMAQIESIVNLNIDIINILIGQGFGALINTSVKSEVFILEFFTKFGLIATIIFILYAMTHIIKNLMCPSRDSKIRGYAAIVLLLIIQSLTNSDITNNIGGILLIIAFIHLPKILSNRNQ